MLANVTIGVPVYNGGGTLWRCIDSLLAQTCPNCVIHIADDGSRDRSRDVARAIVARHPQIRLTLQPTNLGPAGNFGFLLDQAQTEYFMWLAADDWVAPTYVERTLAVLQERPDVVACASRVQFARGGATRLGTGTYPLRQSEARNLAVFLSKPGDNARFYALFRRAELGRAFPPRHFHGYDLAATAGTLRFGKHEEIGETLMFRDDTPYREYIAAIAHDNPRWIDRVLPMFPLTRDLITRQSIPLTLRCAIALIWLNADYGLAHATHRAPRLKRILEVVHRLWNRYIAWRLVTENQDCVPLP